MICLKCGNELKDNMKFCGKCGTAVPIGFYSQPVQANYTPPQSPPSQPTPPQPPPTYTYQQLPQAINSMPKPGNESVFFENIGKKIKGLTKVIFTVSVIINVIIGIITIIVSSPFSPIMGIISGIITIGIGILFSWVSSFFLYGFGELVDSSQASSKHLEELVAIGKHKTH